MEAEQVLDKIRSDAQSRADEILAAAKEQAAAERAKLEEDLAEFDKQTQALAAQAGHAAKDHLLAAARMSITRDWLTEKRAVLDGVFTRAFDRLRALPDDEYRKLVTRLMLESVESGDEEIILDRNEQRITPHVVDEVNQRLSKEDHRGALRLSSQRMDLGGGFVLRRGKIVTNVSFKVLIEQARKDLEIELATMLFA